MKPLVRYFGLLLLILPTFAFPCSNLCPRTCDQLNNADTVVQVHITEVDNSIWNFFSDVRKTTIYFDIIKTWKGNIDTRTLVASEKSSSYTKACGYGVAFQTNNDYILYLDEDGINDECKMSHAFPHVIKALNELKAKSQSGC